MVKALGYLLFLLGVGLAVVAGFVLFAAISDFRARGCPGAVQCSDAISVMVLAASALLAALVMLFSAMVFVRR